MFDACIIDFYQLKYTVLQEGAGGGVVVVGVGGVKVESFMGGGEKVESVMGVGGTGISLP